MKTLKLISLSILLFAAVAVASANETKNLMITSTEDLKNSFKEKIVNDITGSRGYLYQNDINKLEESVQVMFLITPEQTIRVLSTKCKNQQASDYIKQLLDKQPMNVPATMVGMVYHVELKLFFRTN